MFFLISHMFYLRLFVILIFESMTTHKTTFFYIILFNTIFLTPFVYAKNSIDKKMNITNSLKNVDTENDTLEVINCLLKENNTHRYRGEYDLAFQKIWEAWLLADQKKDQIVLQEIHRSLGILYDIFNKDSLSIHHLNTSLSITKKLLTQKKAKKHIAISTYFSLSSFWRKRKDYTKALIYLDSCSFIDNYKRELPYVITDRGYCNLQLGYLDKSEKLLYRGKTLLENIKSPYLVVNLKFLGELKREQKNYTDALFFYKQAIALQKETNVHSEMKPDLFDKIADLYILKGDYINAVANLKASQKSFKRLFGTTNKNNQRLFEIKNNYLAEITENKKVIETQEAIIKTKNKKLALIFSLLGVLLLFSIGMYLLIYQRNKIKKISLINDLDKEKNKAILRVKSKELTSHALKMIEKEEAIETLLKIIKENNPTEYKQLQHKYAKGNDNSWEEFNKRFTEVNVHFHETICKKYPNLSPTELKHCALIKLNFNSHEMAKILNISLQSVHTSRYRIRKKMGLDSNESLQTYIGSI